MDHYEPTEEEKAKLKAGFEAYKSRGETDPAIARTLLNMAWGDKDEPLDFDEYYDYYGGCSGPQLVHDEELSDIEFYRYFPSVGEIYVETKQQLDLESVGVMPNLFSLILKSPITKLPYLGPNLDSMSIEGAKELPTENIAKHPELKYLVLVDHPVDDFAFLADIKKLSDLTLSGGRITSLAELPPLPHLTSLSLSRNSLTSLEGIEKFPNLEDLYIYDNQVESIGPILSLKKLISLDISYNPIKDLHLLAECMGLVSLHGRGLGISDLSFLSDLTAMESLDLQQNAITDLTPLAKLSACDTIDVSYNQLSSLRGIENLQALEVLKADDNLVTDIAFLPAQLDSLHLDRNCIEQLPSKGNDQVQFLYLDHNRLDNLDGIAHMPNLISLHVSHNRIADLTPLTGLNELEYLQANHNLISSVAPLASLANLGQLSLNGNRVSDLSPLKDLEKLDYIHLKDNPLGSGLRKAAHNCPLDANAESLRTFCQTKTAFGEEGPIG